MTGGLRWLVGTVRFRAEGSAAEQLISRAMQNGTVLRNLRREAEGICASVRASEYREVCAQRKGISARARVLKKSGLPFFL